MPPASKKIDLNEFFQQGDVKAEFSVKSTEDEREKSLRLRKDFLGFLVKDLAPYVLAIVFVAAMGIYCFVVLGHRGSTPDEKQRAWAALSAILTGVVGVVFGKSMK